MTAKAGKRRWWTHLQFSLRSLLFWMTLFALGLWSLRNASTGWATLAFWTTIAVLTGALLLAVNREGPVRGWWAGFGICGWIYLLLVPCEVARPHLGFTSMMDHGNLITSRWSDRLYWAVYSRNESAWWRRATPGDPANGTFGSMPMSNGAGSTATPPIVATAIAHGPSRPSHADFVSVAQLHWTIFVAVCGGWISWLMGTGTIPATGRTGNFEN